MFYKALDMLTRWPLFRRERSPERAWDVIAWWESRRIPYNLIVGATGVASAMVMLLTAFVTGHVVGEAIDAQGSPLFEILAVICYGIVANVCFTGGWILELFSRRIWGTRAEAFGESAFTWGIVCLLARVIAGALPPVSHRDLHRRRVFADLASLDLIRNPGHAVVGAIAR